MGKKTVYMQTERGDVFRTTFPEYHKDCKVLPSKVGAELYRAQDIASLKKWLKPGATVYTKLESVSSSGMSRRISVYIVAPKTENAPARIVNITGMAANATGYTPSDKGGITMGGCGMDMGFAIVYALGRAIWPKGTPKPHGTRNGAPDKDGGYALKHSWL